MAIRKKQEPDEYQKALRKFHKKSNRHVVVFEADISEDEKRRIFSDADHLRQCGNELLGIMERNLEQLCAQRDIVPCRNCMEKYRIQSMHWKRKKFYQMRKHKS